MLDYTTLFALAPFSLDVNAKRALHDEWLNELSEHHRRLCKPYDKLVKSLGANPQLPVRLFKDFDLRSVDAAKVTKTMTSSGTTGQRISKIYLDRDTSARQSKALSKIVSDFTGTARMPMLIVDSAAVVRDRNLFSARGAGIKGFSLLGRDITYALDDDMRLQWQVVEEFCAKYASEKVLVFGFTFMIWQYLCKALVRENKDLCINGILIHGGGWKKLIDEAVDNDEFKRVVRETTGIKQVNNYYGMVEQTGSICMECEAGHLHASIFSDIHTVDPLSLKRVEGQKGVIVSASLLPTSYPGHILLTEDVGEVLGIDDCPCGRLGAYFAVYGRQKGAEIRGCSDTHASRNV